MAEASYYETDEAVSEYLLFHYGTPGEILPWPFGPRAALDYPVRCVTECLDPNRLPAEARALDLGCAVGRSAFELARHCREVIGIDYSRRFIDVARQLQLQGSLTYAYREEGWLTTPGTAVVPADIERGRVAFEQGDAQRLRPDLGAFDVVLMANLVDRLPRPRACLSRCADLVRRGGQLIITTPCTWLPEYTAPEEWLGGYGESGLPVRGLATIRQLLEPDFELIQGCDLPFLIREHARKYQWSVAQGSVWLRR